MSVELKIDKILDNITEQRVILARMEIDIRHHIKRSDNHELLIEQHKGTISKLWMAIAALFGAGAQSSLPGLVKFIERFM